MTRTSPLTDLTDISALLTGVPTADADCVRAARQRQATLTKPAGSLGRLEDIAAWLAAWQRRHPPRLEHVCVLVFAGNHGIAARGVSAYPATVTAQMVRNYETGGAAINRLCRMAGAELSVHALDLETPTHDFTAAAAMSGDACLDAVNTGIAALPADADLVAVGEMGIGNTTSAAALCAALFGGAGGDWVGAGTGLDDTGIARKATLVDAALAHHSACRHDPTEALRRLGGREIAAMVGAILATRLRPVPLLLDGFVACAAAAVLQRLAPTALDHCLAAHRSAEHGHARLLAQLGLAPLLDLDMRLGEASGAAVAIPLVRAALVCHNEMASFAEAGITPRR